MEDDINWIRTDRDALREQLDQARDQLREALYNVEYLTKLALGSQAESVKHLMRCPVCGSEDIYLLFREREGLQAWFCGALDCPKRYEHCTRPAPERYRRTVAEALLAWHGLEDT